MEEIFPVKTRNLNGYVLNVTQYEDYPRSFIDKGGKITGTDGHILNLICELLNCSYRIVGPATSDANEFGPLSFSDITSGLAEISFNLRLILLQDLQDVSILYTQEIDALTVLVPQSAPVKSYKNLIDPLRFEAWLYVLLTFFGFIFGYLLFKGRKGKLPKNIGRIFFQIFQIQILVPLPQLPKKIRDRIFLLGFVFYSFVLLNGYQTILTSFLISPRYEPNINTLQQVSDQNISLNVPTGFRNILMSAAEDSTILKQFIEHNLSLWSVKSRPTNNIGYISTRRTGHFFAQTDANFRNGRKILHVVPDGLVYSIATYCIRKNMPYESDINTMLMRIVETGIYQKFQAMGLQEYSHAKHTHNILHLNSFQKTVKVLKLTEVQVAFLLLIAGYLISIITFGCEVYKSIIRVRIRIRIQIKPRPV